MTHPLLPNRGRFPLRAALLCLVGLAVLWPVDGVARRTPAGGRAHTTSPSRPPGGRSLAARRRLRRLPALRSPLRTIRRSARGRHALTRRLPGRTSGAAAARRHRSSSARHSYERGLGQRKRPTRQERRRFDYGGKQDRRVDVAATNRELERLARTHSDQMKLTQIGTAGEHPIYRVDLTASTARGGKNKGRRPMRVLVTGGVHGNEPTGARTAIKLIKRALKDKGMQSRYALTVVPMINPTGLSAVTRKNDEGKDLNRAFRPGKWTTESRALRDSLGQERYDLAVDLHGGWRKGHFLIRGTNDGKLSGRILAAMDSQGLLDLPKGAKSNEIGPYKAHALGGVSSQTAGTLKGYMVERGTPYSYTLEYPRSLAPAKQERQMMRMLRSTLDNVYKYGRYDASRPGGRR